MQQPFTTGVPGFSARFATEEDCGLILGFIQKLARYEKMNAEVVATEAGLRQSLFCEKQAEVIIGEEAGRPVAFSLFFPNYSTFLGKANLYLEDLFVEEECRGRGYGRAMFRCLGQIVRQRGYERLDWNCLNWNTGSIAFYESLGAEAQTDWVLFRLSGEALAKLGGI